MHACLLPWALILRNVKRNGAAGTEYVDEMLVTKQLSNNGLKIIRGRKVAERGAFHKEMKERTRLFSDMLLSLLI